MRFLSGVMERRPAGLPPPLAFLARFHLLPLASPEGGPILALGPLPGVRRGVCPLGARLGAGVVVLALARKTRGARVLGPRRERDRCAEIPESPEMEKIPSSIAGDGLARISYS